ncbi:MAG: KUP/HAK/KT family potassium transporter, partial [Actinobacteria bacterium]|nr:KUP/HAK/KT family potassium transporter [Actinomycetota bacterium]
YAFEFVIAHPLLSFGALSAVTLAITGAEALYADMGHFGRSPITLSWLAIVFPSLVLCYLGQGALLLENPEMIDNPFYHLVPGAVEIPIIILAAVATVIASQAVISGAYSVTRQAMQLGLLPRMRVLQTSAKVRGQIFMPVITLLQYMAVVATVLIFRSSEHLAAAYGLAVTGTLVCTTILAVLVAFHLWRWPKWRIVLIFGPLGIVDIAFFTANMSKIPHGAWFSLVLATILFIIIASWSTGRLAMLRALSGEAVPAEDFTDKVAAGKYKRTEGTGVFLVASPTHVPRPLLATIRNFGRIDRDQPRPVARVSALRLRRVAERAGGARGERDRQAHRSGENLVLRRPRHGRRHVARLYRLPAPRLRAAASPRAGLDRLLPRAPGPHGHDGRARRDLMPCR